MEGVFRFKSWFLNAPGLIHGGAYYRNFTVFVVSGYLKSFSAVEDTGNPNIAN